MAYAAHTPKASFEPFVIYGWTAGDYSDDAAMRTDDILAAVDFECALRPQVPALICGDFNAAVDRLPTWVARLWPRGGLLGGRSGNDNLPGQGRSHSNQDRLPFLLINTFSQQSKDVKLL